MHLDQFILHLSLITGVGIETVKQIIARLDQYSIDDLYTFTESDFSTLYKFSEKKSSLLYKGLANKDLLYKEEERIAKNNTSYISYGNPDYPESLKHIYMPPMILYFKGKHIGNYKQKPMLSIVGSRQANHYATQVIKQFVPEFIQSGVVIVSGGAVGVDTIAHKTAVESKGNTIVVLGSGMSYLYPYQNKTLFHEIIENNGSIISEFPMQEKPEAHNFPQRNRVIAGISCGVVIVQAAAKSGAYITAQCALEQGKEVFAVPGSLFDPLSAGCHTLLKQGAHVADSAASILETCNIPTLNQDIERSAVSEYTALQQQILQVMKRPIFFDDLVETCDNIDYCTLQKELSLLQLQGIVEQELSGAFYRAKL